MPKLKRECKALVKDNTSLQWVLLQISYSVLRYCYHNTASSHFEVFCRKMFIKILQISREIIFAGVYFLIRLQTGNLKLSEAATRDDL